MAASPTVHSAAVKNSLKLLGRSLRHLTCLTTLDLSNNCIPSDCVTALGNCLGNAKKLKNLDLSDNPLCRPAVLRDELFLKFLGALPNRLQSLILKKVNLSYTAMQYEWASGNSAALVAALSSQPSITCLDISGNGLCEAEVLAVLSGLTSTMHARPLARLGILQGNVILAVSITTMKSLMEAMNRGAYGPDEHGHVLELW